MARRNGTSKTAQIDHSDREHLRRRLSELENERDLLFKEYSGAIFRVDTGSGEILEANGKAVSLAGYKIPTLLGMDFKHLIPRHETSSEEASLRPQNGKDGSHATLERHDGTSIPVRVKTRCVHQDQRSMQLVFVQTIDSPAVPRSKPAGDSPHQSAACLPSEELEPNRDFPNIVGRSERIREICQRIGQVAKTDSTVLIHGESGTGKEIVAQAIHFHSRRSKGPFVKVNCAALSETLLESELFGHVKGAFTGAIRDTKGRFKQANGGTILLDEINSMSLSGQAKFLRVLQEREFEPVGASVTKTVDVRVIVACNTDLEKAVAEGTFREDLYYRLNVFSMLMPPMREKKEDIPLLARHFLRKYNLTVRKRIRDLSPDTLTVMMQYDWPGNVRELENAIEHAVIVGTGPLVLPSHLPTNLTTQGKGSVNSNGTDLSLRDRLNLVEKEIILDALTRSSGIKKQAAGMLQIDPRNFPYLLRKHNLSKNGKDECIPRENSNK